MYNQKAFEILNSSINSAVFIDEKAKDFFSGTPINNLILEETLSFNLFNTFKEHGKSLAIHKFEVSNLKNDQVLDYLFKGRDLILLDWELADVAGQEHSLNLLNRAVGTPYLSFCCIYSSAGNFNEIPFFLDSYFSGLSRDEFIIIQDHYGYITLDEIQNVLDKNDDEIISFFIQNSINIGSFPIERMRNKSKSLILRYIFISIEIEKFILPELPNEFEVTNTGEGCFIINNTFILTLKKDINTDSNYTSLLKRISDTITKTKGSFFQLLGLEMQSVFNSNERFIDETILKSSTEALFQFRNHINDDTTFAIIIKKLLIEQATLKLRTAKLKLLDPEFLNFESAQIKDVVTTEDLFQLNVFYNSVTVKGLTPKDIPNLNFGDIFKDSKDNYYLCITALCDCYYPNKIDHNFYFVKGSEFSDIELALFLGDTAFINFLPNNKAVYWGDLEKPTLKKIKTLTYSDNDNDIDILKKEIAIQQTNIEKLVSNQDVLNRFLYKPFFIKPKVYNVENNNLVDNKMRIWDITNKFKKEEFDQDINYFDVVYVTTLRNDYAQRIANHAFGHPSRVGVDFIKK